MAKYINLWRTVKMTALKSDKIYTAHLCPRCDYETVVQTNACPRCGKLLKGVDVSDESTSCRRCIHDKCVPGNDCDKCKTCVGEWRRCRCTLQEGNVCAFFEEANDADSN